MNEPRFDSHGILQNNEAVREHLSNLTPNAPAMPMRLV